MCGICGIAFADRERRVARATLGAMCDSLAHRGPDDQGLYVDRFVGLGHRRLSIVDVGAGHQPMSNEDGSVWVSYNGEIYNHAGFRGRLLARGHTLRTRCDTEAIVHLYEDHGSDAVRELRGMFAFALWDARRETLLLARDRSGIKPLFYAVTRDGDLVFASEIKAIFRSGLVDAEIDDRALPEFFASGHVSGRRTLYRGVWRLPAGHLLRWRAGTVDIERYWTIGDGSTAGPVDGDGARHEADAGGLPEAFWRRFTAAVGSQLMSDVPLGVFLSGGLDSSLIVAAMRERGVSEIRTFSVGFAERSASELPFARVAASAFDTIHREVTLSGSSFFDALPRLTAHRDQPLSFSASIPLFLVAQLAAEDVKVVLTGEGSDELFAGYGRYPRGLLNLRLARLLDASTPWAIRRAVGATARRLGDGYLASRIKRSFLAQPGTIASAYLEAFADFDAQHRRALLRRNDEDAFEPMAQLVDPTLAERNPLESLLRLDQATYLEELLMKQDQMSMAASIESRVPFLDESLVDWSASLPPAAKLRGAVGKVVVRAAAARHLPASIAHGQKRGFPVPLGAWLRGPGRRWLEEYAPRATDALLEHRYVRRLIAEHLAGGDHTARLWRILAFQVWRRDVAGRFSPAAADLPMSRHAQRLEVRPC